VGEVRAAKTVRDRLDSLHVSGADTWPGDRLSVERQQRCQPCEFRVQVGAHGGGGDEGDEVPAVQPTHLLVIHATGELSVKTQQPSRDTQRGSDPRDQTHVAQSTSPSLDIGDPGLRQPEQAGELQLRQSSLCAYGGEHLTEVVAGQRAAQSGSVIEAIRNRTLEADGASTRRAHRTSTSGAQGSVAQVAASSLSVHGHPSVTRRTSATSQRSRKVHWLCRGSPRDVGAILGRRYPQWGYPRWGLGAARAYLRAPAREWLYQHHVQAGSLAIWLRRRSGVGVRWAVIRRSWAASAFSP
jgi:hypothetical protein